MEKCSVHFSRFLFRSILCIGLLLPFGDQASANPTPVHDEVLARERQMMQIKYLFNMRKFDELEALHFKYLTEQSRTPSGLWNLTLFHAALNLRLFDIPGHKAMDETGYEPFFKEWMERYPKSEAAHLMRARVYFNKIDQIYEMIGNEQPSSNQWRLIKEYLDSIELYISRHRSPDARDPHWDQLNLQIAMRRSLDRAYMERLAKGAFDRSPYFYENYFDMVYYYKRYSNKPQIDIEILARDAIKRTKEKEGNGLYSRIYWAASSGHDSQIITKSNIDWNLMKSSMDDVLSRWSDDWNRSAFAKFSCWRRDKTTATVMMSKIQKPYPYIAEIWNGTKAFRECQDFIASKSLAAR
jgi:hypothetical protein